jgi:hypothetical protein
MDALALGWGKGGDRQRRRCVKESGPGLGAALAVTGWHASTLGCGERCRCLLCHGVAGERRRGCKRVVTCGGAWIGRPRMLLPARAEGWSELPSLVDKLPALASTPTEHDTYRAPRPARLLPHRHRLVT